MTAVTLAPVQRDLIYGKAAFVYWPFREAGVVHLGSLHREHEIPQIFRS